MLDTAYADLTARMVALASDFPVNPSPEDFEALRDRCESAIGGLKAFLLRAAEAALRNDPGNTVKDAGLPATIDALLSDLQGDISGTLDAVAARMIDTRYDGCVRGPMFRRRA